MKEATEIAEQSRNHAGKLAKMVMLDQEVISLEQPVHENDNSSLIGDFLESDGKESPETHVMDSFLQDDVDKMLQTLDSREEAVIRARYGLGNNGLMSLEEIGAALNLSKEAVRQIENKALQRLRQPDSCKKLESYVA